MVELNIFFKLLYYMHQSRVIEFFIKITVLQGNLPLLNKEMLEKTWLYFKASNFFTHLTTMMLFCRSETFPFKKATEDYRPLDM